MKKALLTLFAAAALSLTASTARAGMVFDGVTTNSSATRAVGSAERITVHVICVGTCVGVVTVSQHLPGMPSTTEMVRWANPDEAGRIYGGTGGGVLTLAITGYTSGTYYVAIEGYTGTTKVVD